MEARQVEGFSLVDLIDFCFKLNSVSHAYWQFYAAINTVIVGWLLTASIDLSLWQKLMLTLGIVIMLVLSVASLHSTYGYLFAVLDEVKSVANTIEVRSQLLRKALVSIRPLPYWAVYAVHLAVSIAVLAILWELV